MSEPTAMNECIACFATYYYSRGSLSISPFPPEALISLLNARFFFFLLQIISPEWKRGGEGEKSTELLDTICSCNNNLCPVPFPLRLPPLSPSGLHLLPAYINTDFSPLRESSVTWKNNADPSSRVPDCEIASSVFYLSIPLLERYVADVALGPALRLRRDATRREYPARENGSSVCRSGCRANFPSIVEKRRVINLRRGTTTRSARRYNGPRRYRFLQEASRVD